MWPDESRPTDPPATAPPATAPPAPHPLPLTGLDGANPWLRLRSGGVSFPPLPLTGLDGANPLAFLAALGTLVVCDRLSRRPDAPAWLAGTVTLSWGVGGASQLPVLHLPAPPPTERAFAEYLAARLDRSPDTHPSSWVVNLLKDRKPDVAAAIQRCAPGPTSDDGERLGWITALACESAPEATSQLQTVRRDYMVGNLMSVMARTGADHLERCLFRPWDYADALDNQSLHWEPSEDRRHAYQWHQPNGDPTRKRQGGMLGANRLALEAWPLLPSFPSGAVDKAQTRGFRGTRANETSWTWPLWRPRLTADAAASMLGLWELVAEEPTLGSVGAYGVTAVLRSRRILVGKTPNLTSPAVLV